MENITSRIFSAPPFGELSRALAGMTPGVARALSGVAGSMVALVASYCYGTRMKPVLVIAPDEDRAEKIRDDCALLNGDTAVRYFGSRPLHQAQQLDVTSSIAQIESLRSLAAGDRVIIVASSKSVAEHVPEPGRFSESLIELRSGTEVNFRDLLGKLEQLGFDRKSFVESYGDMAVRGGIVDVFPYVGEHPIRFEFWGDTIESIREFDVLSQRSIRELQSAVIAPSLLRAGEEQDVPENAATVFDYFPSDTIILFHEPAEIERETGELQRETGIRLLDYDGLLRETGRYPLLLCSATGSMLDGRSSGPVIPFGSRPQPSFNGSVKRLLDTLRQLEDDGYTIHLSADTRNEAARLRELLDEAVGAETDGSGVPAGGSAETPGAHPGRVIHPETLHSGFIFESAKIAVITEHEVFNRLRRRGLAKRRRFRGFSQKELHQLRRGDPVVHVDHGIGTFAGLSTIRVGGIEQEVMKLLFEGGDMLYVNLNYVNRVQKYSSQEGHVPKLSRLGSGEWDRVKERARKRIKDIARDLIEIYAKRKSQQGFAFSPDSHWQKELEASFLYEDTVDQAKATDDVKRDMENPSPMDRLICGDVGFGKTEVAVRAAFKAVMDGKQVAVLVPTTILAIQHYNTFLDRLSRYTTRIDHLTRFRSAKEQKMVVGDLLRGSVDIVIGTHRLLSKDIAFKQLGLLIIDEEHRFGVAAKEKLRKLQATVDTLSLTATPIPRTLHFSLIGARDLSIIGTPPRNRLPIETEIIPGSEGRNSQWQVIREAILRELHRGGQVYVVHDRVQNIDTIAAEVSSHVPEAAVRTAHGQMPGHQLERTMLDFLEKKFNVLVATKIIESGLDIPSVNTIVINRADRFGLAELYQLRGRVGRSNVQAFAYLLVPPLSVLPKQALRRLQAIEEFTELGSGLNLAMRDLEIRGAGNLLGAEQSGFIMEMGFELYERIVREAVSELKEEEFRGIVSPDKDALRVGGVETVVDADVDALIPDVYIESDTERLEIYRRLYRLGSPGELDAMREEVIDRFGEYPVEVEHLFCVVGLRMDAAGIGIPKVSLREDSVVLTLPPDTDERFYGKDGDREAPFRKLMEAIPRRPKGSVRFQQSGQSLLVHLTLPPGLNSPAERISAAGAVLRELFK